MLLVADAIQSHHARCSCFFSIATQECTVWDGGLPRERDFGIPACQHLETPREGNTLQLFIRAFLDVITEGIRLGNKGR